MKKMLLSAALILGLGGSQPAFAIGVVIESIKAHVDQHQPLTHPRQVERQEASPAPQSTLEQWLRSMSDFLPLAK